MKSFKDLIRTVRILRSPGGCPWDRAQTIGDMKKYLLEEVYELIDAIDKDNPQGTCEEIGDVFLILVVISEMFAEKASFGLEDALEKINTKLIERHPHVFSSKTLETKEEVLRHWIKDKAEKKKRKSLKDRLPLSAPALLLAYIFFKEKSNLAHSRPEPGVSLKVRWRDLKAALDSTPELADEELFFDILLKICEIGCISNLDLEGGLRKKIFAESLQVNYNVDNEKNSVDA